MTLTQFIMKADRLEQNIAQDVVDATYEPVPASLCSYVPHMIKNKRRESQSNLSDFSNKVDEWQNLSIKEIPTLKPVKIQIKTPEQFEPE